LQVSPHCGKNKARKSDSAVVLQREKRSSSSRASIGEAEVGGFRKAYSKGGIQSKTASARSNIARGRKDDSIKFLSAERKRLEKENKEKRRLLEELKKQELLIEAAAKKGGMVW